MTRRNLVHISREPMQLSDVTIQPVLFTFLFVYIFGGAIPIPGGGSYIDYLLAGLLSLNLVTSTMGTAVGLSTDLHEGMIDRFRTLPMWRSAVLVGRSLADLHDVVPLRAHRGIDGVGRRVAARGQLSSRSWLASPGALVRVRATWIAACVGMNQEPRVGGLVRLHRALPVGLRLERLVPTQHMPGWLQAIADWNPVSAVTAGARVLWGNPNPSGTIHAWPMQHPVRRRLIWSVVILAIAAPLAAHFFKRRTTE